jgi:hypothetical protein
MPKDRTLEIKHWTEEIRNAMYQLTDGQLVEFFRAQSVEAERIRVCLNMIDDDEEQEVTHEID